MNIVIAVSLFLTFAFVGGCAPVRQVQVEPSKPVKLTTKQINVVKKAVSKNLKDPYSARYRGIVASRVNDWPITVCGWVNAKNSYGAYTGDAPFIGELGTIGFYPSSGPSSDEYEAASIKRACAVKSLYLR